MARLETPKPVLDTLDFVWAGDANGFNPADSTTYFSGQFPALDPATTQTGIRLIVPYPCTVVLATIAIVVSGTLGTNENSTFAIRANTSTDSTLSTTIKMNAASIINVISGLSINLAAGDSLQVKVTTPAWVTNPTGVLYQVSLVVQLGL